LVENSEIKTKYSLGPNKKCKHIKEIDSEYKCINTLPYILHLKTKDFEHCIQSSTLQNVAAVVFKTIQCA
jgi:hypothetical protein